MDIKIIANARRNSAKKPSKSEVWAQVLSLIEKCPENENIGELSALYAYFMPNAPKKPKTPEQWLSLAKAKNDIRYYLNNVYHDGEKLLATDGHRLHYIHGYDANEGYYDSNMVALDNSTGDLGKYPDCNRVIPDCSKMKSLAHVSVDSLKNHTISPDKGMPYEAFLLEIGEGKTFTRIAFNKSYFLDAISFMSDPDLYYTDENHSILLKDGDMAAVIMPIRQ